MDEFILDNDGNKKYYVNGTLHREDGPAVIYANRTKKWYINGELHRDDGPAIECCTGLKAWYKKGVLIGEEKIN